VTAAVRSLLYDWLQRIITWLLHLFRILFGKGFIKMNFHTFSQLATTSNVLRVLGASVGQNSHIHSDICIYNEQRWSCHNLTIGSNVYVGPRCIFDLTSSVVIDNDASVSAQVTFITHLDVGNQPLKKTIPRTEGPIRIGRGAWVGVNTTILQDVTIGEFAMVGAMSLVNKDVPARSLAFGIPSHVVRQLSDREEDS